jgi:hypothetical protein
MGQGKVNADARLTDYTKEFNDKYGLQLTPQDMKQAIIQGNLEAYKATHMKADQGMEKLAEEGTKKGSIFTHDIYCEAILEQMLKTMGGDLQAARESVAKKEIAMADPQMLGAFASDQGQEANITGFNDKIGLATLNMSELPIEKEKRIVGESSMIERGLFDHSVSKDALHEANRFKESEIELNRSSTTSNQQVGDLVYRGINRLSEVIDDREKNVVNRNQTTMQNTGLFSKENIQDVNSEYLGGMAKYHGTDLNNVLSTIRSSEIRKLGTVDSGTTHYIDGEDSEYSTLSSSLYSAQLESSRAGKGYVTSNLMPKEDAEEFVAQRYENSKPTGSMALIPGLDGILAHLSGESAEREKEMVYYLREIRSLMLREQGPPAVGSMGNPLHESPSRLNNWMTDRLTGAWTELQHDPSSPTSNLTGDTRGGK